MPHTATIPIVFTSGVDPVKVGLVASLNRPERNLTGISWFNAELTAKGLGLLRELVPNAAVVALLINPNSPEATSQPEDALVAARILGQSLLVMKATIADEIDATFPTLVERRVGALVVGADPLGFGHHNTYSARAHEFCNGGQQVDGEDEQV